MPAQDQPPMEDEAKFSVAEDALFQKIRRMADVKANKLDPDQKTKLFLGCASELVDAAADTAAGKLPRNARC